MALGSNYQSGNQGNNTNKMYEPTYYSRLRIKNPLENLSVSFTFWSGTLKISITDTTSIPENGKVNDLAFIYLSPTKARVFSECVERVIKNPESSDTFGVNTGSGDTNGFIAIGRDMGKPFLFIAKVDKEGKYQSSQRFNFNYDYNYLLRVNDLNSLKIQKEYCNTVELEQLYDILTDYARAASGALGAMIHDTGRYEAAKLSGMVRKLCEASGVNTGSGYNKSNGNGNNAFFSGADEEYAQPGSSPVGSVHRRSTYQSIDDLEDELG